MPTLDTPQTDWNLNSHKINFIGRKMINTIEYFEKSFKNNKSVRITISNRLNPDEMKKCKKYEKAIPKQTLKDNMGKSRITWKYVDDLEEYIEYVQVLIKDKGLDLSEKSESSLF